MTSTFWLEISWFHKHFVVKELWQERNEYVAVSSFSYTHITMCSNEFFSISSLVYGQHHIVLRIISDSIVKDYSWWCSKYHKGLQGLTQVSSYVQSKHPTYSTITLVPAMSFLINKVLQFKSTYIQMNFIISKMMMIFLGLVNRWLEEYKE